MQANDRVATALDALKAQSPVAEISTEDLAESLNGSIHIVPRHSFAGAEQVVHTRSAKNWTSTDETNWGFTERSSSFVARQAPPKRISVKPVL